MELTWEALGVITGILVLIVGAVGIILRMGESKGTKESSIKKIQCSIDNLPCKKNEGYETERKLAYHQINAMAKKVGGISEWVMNFDSSMISVLANCDSPVSVKSSPMNLNDLGIQILHMMGGVEFLDENKDYLIRLIDESDPKTSLDVERLSRNVCLMATSHEMFNNIKDRIYKAPSIKVDVNGIQKDFVVTLGNVCSVLSIPLRDLYLLKHPELLPKDD